MIKELIVGASSGYFLKILQTLCSLLILPFILSDDNLGLKHYGWLVSLLVIQAFMSMVLDGWRLNISKFIGENKGNISILLPRILILTFIQIVPLILLVVIFSEELIEFLAVGAEYSSAIYLITGIVLIEQLSFPFEAAHHAQLKTWRVNLISTLEVLVRTVSIFSIFIMYEASISTYLYIWFFSRLFNFTLLLYSTNTMYVFNFKGLLNNIPFRLVTESLPLTFKGLSSFLILRGSIIYANKYIGGEASAIVSIIITTIRNYFFQAFVSVMRAMIIPVSSSLLINEITGKRKEKIKAILFIFQFIVMLTMLLMALSVDVWMPIWLPKIPDNMYILISISIIVFMLEIQNSPVNYLLVSQGHGKVLSYYSLMLSVAWVCMITTFSSSIGYLDIKELILCVILYLFIYNGLIVNYLVSKYIKNIKSNVCYGSLYIAILCSLMVVTFSYGEYPSLLIMLFVMSFSMIAFNYFICPYVKLYSQIKKVFV